MGAVKRKTNTSVLWILATATKWLGATITWMEQIINEDRAWTDVKYRAWPDKSRIALVAGVWIQAVIHMQRKVSFIPAVGPIFLVTQHQRNLRY